MFISIFFNVLRNWIFYKGISRVLREFEVLFIIVGFFGVYVVVCRVFFFVGCWFITVRVENWYFGRLGYFFYWICSIWVKNY